MSGVRTQRSRRLDAARLADHVDRLYRAARALTGHAQDAEDLTQETYARVLARPRTIERDSDVGYLLTTLRHTFIEQRRRRRPEPLPLADVAEQLPERSARTQPEDAAAHREVFATIAGLPHDFRDAIAAVDVAGLSYQEAAELLEVPVGTVMSRLYRGRRRVVAGLAAA